MYVQTKGLNLKLTCLRNMELRSETNQTMNVTFHQRPTFWCQGDNLDRSASPDNRIRVTDREGFVYDRHELSFFDKI